MDKTTKRNIIIAASYAAVLALGIVLGQAFYKQNRNSPTAPILVPIGTPANVNKVQQLIDLVSTYYVDSLNMDSVENGAIQHIISHLDPYSNYLLPKSLKDHSEALEGTFEGIGLEYFNLNDTLIVVGLISEGPADIAGFKVGDKLLRIADQAVSGKHIAREEVEKLLRGRRGTTVDIEVERPESSEPFIINVVRDQVTVSSVDVAYMLEPGVGYIKLRRFGLKTAEEFRHSLEELKKQGMQKLILDLRNNGGGYFHIAVKVAGEFFQDKRLIVYIEGAHEPRSEYFSDGDGVAADEPLVLLINENTASASEIVAGAVQDWDRGVVLGRRSYGKGIVQEQFDFVDGSSVSLSVAKYYTPVGRSIQKKYTPNWSSTMNYTSMYQGLWAMDTLYAEGKSYTTHSGRKVWSGGGVLPDILLEKDSLQSDKIYKDISRSNYIEQFVYGRFTRQSPAYSIENFLQGYHLPEEEYGEFINFLSQRGIELNFNEKRGLHDLIQSDIEALVGRYYFGREAYFKVKNRGDYFIEQSLSILHGEEDAPEEALLFD